MKKVIIDCLGGDNPQEEVASGVLSCLDYPLDFVLAGEEAKLRPIFLEAGVDMARLEFIDASYTLGNDEDPRSLVRGKEDSSLVQAMLRLKEDDAIAYIGAGSTGATLLASIFRLGLLPSVKFPSLGCFIYNYKKEKVCLLDCGANVDARPSQLVQFAKIGSAYVKKVCGIDNAPIFCPIVAPFAQGMEVTVPLFKSDLRGNIKDIIELYKSVYTTKLVHFDEVNEEGFLTANKYANYDDMGVSVYGNDDRIILVSRFDNLGKGASGAGV